MSQLTDNNRGLILPKNSNLLNFSVLTEFYNNKPYRSFSVKYVVEGMEQYSVNGKKYKINSHHYLLANTFSEGDVFIESKKPVKGICIDVAPSIITDVTAALLKPETTETELDLNTFLNSPLFLENIYPAKATGLGSFLMKREEDLINVAASGKDLSRETYFQIAEKIVCDQISVFKQFQTIKAVKLQTKKELLRKLLLSKIIIDSEFLKELSVEFVARQIGLSEYHFFRLFKRVYKISPYQYIISKRLNYAMELIKKEKMILSDLATQCGFADPFSFSKAFKKFHGVNPSTIN